MATAVALLPGCQGETDPGQVRFRVTSTPPPDDKLLSPLTDPRLTSLELRARDDRNREVVIGRTRYEPGLMTGAAQPLGLGDLPVSGKRDMRLYALGQAGQQVLGLALTRDVEVSFGQPKQYDFELHRPLFFVGSARRLVASLPLDTRDQPFSPGRRIPEGVRDAAAFRVVDPNSGQPLLSQYSLKLEDNQQATASVATTDGLSVLLATAAGNLYVIETLRLKSVASVKLTTDLPAQVIATSPRDDSAVILHYELTPPALGRVGRVTFLRDLPGLRARVSKDGDPLSSDITSTTMVPLGPPLSAAYAPDGLVDVVFGKPPINGGDPDCALLSGPGKSTLRRYDPRTGEVKSTQQLEYTTAVAYGAAGQMVLAQPCAMAKGAMLPGQVVVRSTTGDVMAQRTLAAPGSAGVAVAGGVVLAVGRDDVVPISDSLALARGVVRLLEPGFNDWTQFSFPLSEWFLPFVVTVTGEGVPLPSSVEVVLAPKDMLVYRLVATPDATRALALARVTHQATGLAVESYSDGTRIYACRLDWIGYTYHALLLNLQTGAREQDFLTGVQNQTCESRLVDDLGKNYGPCFQCDLKLTNPERTLRLRGYQEGFIPGGTSALFSGQ